MTGEEPMTCRATTSRRLTSARSIAAIAKVNNPIPRMTAASVQTMVRRPATKS